MLEPVSGNRDKGLVAVLLEEHPLQGERACQPFRRKKARALRQIEQDRVGLREAGPVLQFQHRDAPVGVLGQEGRGSGLPVQDIDLDMVVGDAEMGEQQAWLVAIAGGMVVV